MGLFYTRASLEVNGVVYPDVQKVTEDARKPYKKVNLMYSSGEAPITQRFGGTFEYPVPQVNPPVFDALVGGTLTIEYDGGERVSFGGVACEEVGEITVDMENEAKKTIRWIAETRNGSTGA
jgi:hypothetical protein